VVLKLTERLYTVALSVVPMVLNATLMLFALDAARNSLSVRRRFEPSLFGYFAWSRRVTHSAIAGVLFSACSPADPTVPETTCGDIGSDAIRSAVSSRNKDPDIDSSGGDGVAPLANRINLPTNRVAAKLTAK
jgi:hypothetical protein